MAKKITIYTTNTCAYCGRVKKYLGNKGHEFEEINIDQQPHKQQEALEISGALTVPVTVVTKEDDSQSVIVGWNLSQLAPALG